MRLKIVRFDNHAAPLGREFAPSDSDLGTVVVPVAMISYALNSETELEMAFDVDTDVATDAGRLAASRMAKDPGALFQTWICLRSDGSRVDLTDAEVEPYTPRPEKLTRSEKVFQRWFVGLGAPDKELLTRIARRMIADGAEVDEADEETIALLDAAWKDAATHAKVDSGTHVLDMVVV